MTAILKELKKHVWLGKLNEIELNKVSQRNINMLLFFAYEKKKMQAVELLLPHLITLQFNKGKNILSLLIKDFYIKEAHILETLKNQVIIHTRLINKYKLSIKEIAKKQGTETNILTDWENFLNYKLSESFSQHLHKKLTDNNPTLKIKKL